MTLSGHPLRIWKAQVVFIRTSVPELPKTGEHFTQKMGLCGLPVKRAADERCLDVRVPPAGFPTAPPCSGLLHGKADWGSWPATVAAAVLELRAQIFPPWGQEKRDCLQRTNYSVMQAVIKGGAFYYQREASERGKVETWFISSLNNFWEFIPF